MSMSDNNALSSSYIHLVSNINFKNKSTLVVGTDIKHLHHVGGQSIHP